MAAIETTPAPLQYLCPKHQTKLLYVLKGGAGYCRDCGVYVQADGIPEPTRGKPKSKAKPGKKARKRAQAPKRQRGRAALKNASEGK